MRKIIIGLILLGCSISVSAQAIRLRSTITGKVSIARDKWHSIIDLRSDVSGCAYVPLSTKRELDKRSCAASPATFKLVDAAFKDNQTFLVVQSEAMGNCNVCGQCGASEAYALIWLKLDARLRLLEKKSVPIEYCRENISLVGNEISVNENTQDESLKLSLKSDVLSVEFEKTLFTENSDISGYEFSHLEYSRKTPEKGFVIKTEKRVKSSIKE